MMGQASMVMGSNGLWWPTFHNTINLEVPVEAQVLLIQETRPLINLIYPHFGDGLLQQLLPLTSVPLSSGVPLENVVKDLRQSQPDAREVSLTPLIDPCTTHNQPKIIEDIGEVPFRV